MRSSSSIFTHTAAICSAFVLTNAAHYGHGIQRVKPFPGSKRKAGCKGPAGRFLNQRQKRKRARQVA